MKRNQNQKVDLLISHSQILVRSIPYSEELSQWGNANIEQGAIIYKDYVIFDPLPEDTFGANVYLQKADNFTIDEQAQRCIVTPFNITNSFQVEVASASEKFKVELDLTEGLYSLYYEICEGDEVFYKFTFVPAKIAVEPKYIMDDPWGGEKDKALKVGLV